jgi:hypothetical protein
MKIKIDLGVVGKRRVFIVLAICGLLLVLIIVFLLTQRGGESQLSNKQLISINEKAAEQFEAGDNKAAAQILEKAYNENNNKVQNAELATTIGRYYLPNTDRLAGEKWINKAIDIYRELGNAKKADQLEEEKKSLLLLLEQSETPKRERL